LIRSRASNPLLAILASKPSLVNSSFVIFWLMGLSSTMRILSVEGSVKTGRVRSGAEDECFFLLI
jgi:hypothetical protein